MKIGGINSFSFIEYPGKISCVVYLSGCNFRCGYCHNKEFVLSKGVSWNDIPEQVFFHFLSQRKGLIDGVSICGGEPTLQKEIVSFCEKIKKMGFLVKLDTNGTNPSILQSLFENNLVDYVAMDVKYSFGDYSVISGVKEYQAEIEKSIELIKHESYDYEFRTTCISPYHTEKVIESIGKTLSGAKKWYLQNFRHGDTLDAGFTGTSFSLQKLKKLLNIAKKYVVSAEIRV